MRLTVVLAALTGILLAGCKNKEEQKAKEEILTSKKRLAKEIDEVAAGKKGLNEKLVIKEGSKIAKSLGKIRSYKQQGAITRKMVALRTEFSGLFKGHHALLDEYTSLGGATNELLLSPAKMKQVIVNRKKLISTNTDLLTKIPAMVIKVAALLKEWKSVGPNPVQKLYKTPKEVFAMDLIAEMLKLEKLAGAKEIERLELVLRHPGKVKLTNRKIDIADGVLLKKFNNISDEYAAILKKSAPPLRP